MRAFLVWTLSILLGLEPAVFAANPSLGRTADVKAFLEYSQIGTKQMTIREFVAAQSSYIPETLKQDLQVFLNNYGDQLMPKLDINKISVNGVDQYQWQAVQKGKAVSATLTLGQDVFAKVNGQTITWNDVQNPATLMRKLGVPGKAVAENFPSTRVERGIASVGQKNQMNAERFLKLNKEQKRQYIYQLRGLLESMEAVENAMGGNSKIKGQGKTSSVQNQKFELVARLLAGEMAVAAGAVACVAAGNMTTVGLRGNHQACGAGLANSAIQCPFGANGSKPGLRCNTVIYPSDDNGRGHCVEAGPHSTRDCNTWAQDPKEKRDIPDIARDKAEFDRLQNSAKEAAAKLESFCDGVDAVQVHPKIKSDQQGTCDEFRTRKKEIESWACNSDPKAEINTKHPNMIQICQVTGGAAPGTTPTSTTLPAGVTTTTTASGATTPPATGGVNCNNLPWGYVFDSSECKRYGANPQTGTCANANGSAPGAGKLVPYQCVCSNELALSLLKQGSNCPGAPVAGAADSSSGRGPKKKDGPNWLLIGGIAIGFMVLMHWLTKKAFSEAYGQINPGTQVPDITVPPLPTTLAPPTPIPLVPKSAQ